MRAIRRRSTGIALLCSAGVACLTSGCLTRTVRTEIFNHKYTEVFLRGETTRGTPVDRGYDHPARSRRPVSILWM